jgi:thermitase
MSRRSLFLAAVLVGGLCQGVPGAATEPTIPEFHPDWIVVKLKAPLDDLQPDGSFSLATGSLGLDAAILEEGIDRIEHALRVSMRAPRNPDALARHGLDRVYKFHIPVGADVRVVAERFARLPEVEIAEPDPVNRVTATVPNDPLFVGQWAFDQASDADVDGPEAWDITTGGRLVILAIVDSGIDSSHPEFAGKIVSGYDFVDNDGDPQDDFNHGTRTASVAAANTNNAVGMAGTCWRCRIMPLRIFDADGLSIDTRFVDAMVYATDNGADVINYSGVGANSTLKVTGIHYAYDAGVIFVGSAGNEFPLVQFPARYLQANAIGASNNLDEKADFSAAGDWLDVLAPGEQILVLNNDGTFTNANGTSYSAPLVVGLFGLVKSVHSSVGREEARQLVIAGADDEVGGDLPGWDTKFGWGRANMHRTLLGTQSVTTLRVGGRSSTRLYYDTANPLAESYDFIRGNLDALTETGEGVGLGNVVCLENDSPDPDTSGDEDVGIPALGEAYFYLGRFNAGAWPGSYGGSSRNRDRMTPDPAFAADWFVTLPDLTSELGTSVDTAGDVDNDGYDDVIVGALGFPAPGGTGAAFVYRGSAAGLSTTAAWSIESDEIESDLGNSVGGAGDINGDGYGRTSLRRRGR